MLISDSHPYWRLTFDVGGTTIDHPFLDSLATINRGHQQGGVNTSQCSTCRVRSRSEVVAAEEGQVIHRNTCTGTRSRERGSGPRQTSCRHVEGQKAVLRGRCTVYSRIIGIVLPASNMHNPTDARYS